MYGLEQALEIAEKGSSVLSQICLGWKFGERCEILYVMNHFKIEIHDQLRLFSILNNRQIPIERCHARPRPEEIRDQSLR